MSPLLPALAASRGAAALVAATGERASYRFFEFFTAQIRNPNTRRAYARAAVEFFDWLRAVSANLKTSMVVSGRCCSGAAD
jgi:hypothetical protein